MKKSLFIIIGILIIVFIVSFIVKNLNSVEIGEFKYFKFSYSTGYAMNSSVSYAVRLEGNKYYATIKLDGVSEEDAVIVEVDDNTIDKIINVLKKYHVEKWNGFNKSNKHVMDGNSFSLTVRMKNDDYISATGYMMWPKNYSNVKSELDNIFKNCVKEEK